MRLLDHGEELIAALANLLALAEKQLDQSATHDGLTNAAAIAAARQALAKATGN